MFEERFRQSRSSNGEELALLSQAVIAAVADGTRLNTTPAAFGSRVRLIHFGLCVLQAAHSSHDVVRPSAGPSRRGSSFMLSPDQPGISQMSSRIGFQPPPLSARQGTGNMDDAGLWDDGTTVSGSQHVDSNHTPHELAPEQPIYPADLIGKVAAFSGERWPGICVGSLSTLRERLYRAALAWFVLPMCRYEVATSPYVVRQDFPYLVSLCRFIQVRFS